AAGPSLLPTTDQVGRGSVELGEGAADAADALVDALLVLHQREPHEALAAGPEAHTRRHRDLRFLYEHLGELETAHLDVRLGDRRPHEHRPLGLVDLPSDA